jgi:ribose transport system substrate-binding protein
MRLRHPLAAAMAAALAMAIGACGSSDSSDSSGGGASTGGAAEKGGRIAIFSKVRNAADTCKDKAMESFLKNAGYDVSTYYSNFEPALSNQNIQDALTKGIDGALYGGQTPALDTVSLKRLADAGVPTVLNVGSLPPGSTAAVTMPADAVRAGSEAIETLLKLRPDVEKIGVIPGTPSVTVDETMKGINAALAAARIRPVAVVNGDFTAQGGAKVAQDMLQAHPEIEVIVTMGDDMALAASRVARTGGSKAEVVDVYGFSADAVAAVRNGDLLAMIYASFADWGRQIAGTMVDVMEHKDVPKTITLQLQPVDKSNVDDIKAEC